MEFTAVLSKKSFGRNRDAKAIQITVTLQISILACLVVDFWGIGAGCPDLVSGRKPIKGHGSDAVWLWGLDRAFIDCDFGQYGVGFGLDDPFPNRDGCPSTDASPLPSLEAAQVGCESEGRHAPSGKRLGASDCDTAGQNRIFRKVRLKRLVWLCRY